MCDYKDHRTKSGEPIIVHEGERILSAKQTRALAKAEREGRVNIPVGGIMPEKITKTESAKMLRHYLNGTKRGPKAPRKSALLGTSYCTRNTCFERGGRMLAKRTAAVVGQSARQAMTKLKNKLSSALMAEIDAMRKNRK